MTRIPNRFPVLAWPVRQATTAARLLSSPLLPDDYLGLVNPLWSTRRGRAVLETIRPETPDAATVVLRVACGWPGHRAGQYLRIGVDVDGVRHWRTYSLTSPAQRADDRVSITVKAAPEGLVSPSLVHRLRPGTVVRVEGPLGDFVLPDPTPDRLLFLTAGSGISPIMGMLRTFATEGNLPDTVLVHSARTREDTIFRAELHALARAWPALRLHERHTARAGRLPLTALPRLCPDWAEREVFACGPAGMLNEIAAHWQTAGHPDRLHVERFHPAVLAPAGSGGTVRFSRTGRTIEADGSTPLLTVGENAGVLMPSGCRMGICYSCVAPLRAGQVQDLRTGAVHGEDGDLIQTCVSAAAGPVQIDL